MDTSTPPKKQVSQWGVLIGVDDYSSRRTSHFRNLKGAVNDVGMISHFLSECLGVPEGNIRLLVAPLPDDPMSAPKAQLPTKDNILKTLEEIAQLSRPGDFVFVHFSGYGLTVPNDGAALALIDGDLPVKKFGQRLNHMASNRITVLVTLDACHSGSGVYQGSEQAQASASIREAPATNLKSWLFSPGNNLNVIASCRPDEISVELRFKDRTYGLFTARLIQSLESLYLEDRIGKTTYAALEYLLQANLGTDAKQHPEFGGRKNRLLFQADLVPDDLLQGVARVVRVKRDCLTINRGNISAMIGDIYRIWNPAFDFKSPGRSYEVKLSQVDSETSKAVPIQPHVSLEGVNDGWVAQLVQREDSYELWVRLTWRPEAEKYDLIPAIQKVLEDSKHLEQPTNGAPQVRLISQDDQALTDNHPVHKTPFCVRILHQNSGLNLQFLDRKMKPFPYFPSLSMKEPNMAQHLTDLILHLHSCTIMEGINSESLKSEPVTFEFEKVATPSEFDDVVASYKFSTQLRGADTPKTTPVFYTIFNITPIYGFSQIIQSPRRDAEIERIGFGNPAPIIDFRVPKALTNKKDPVSSEFTMREILKIFVARKRKDLSYFSLRNVMNDNGDLTPGWSGTLDQDALSSSFTIFHREILITCQQKEQGTWTGISSVVTGSSLEIDDGGPLQIATAGHIENQAHWTELHLASAQNNKTSVEKIIREKRFNVNQQLELLDRSTPLHIAARYGSNDVVPVLLQYGANIAQCDAKRKSAEDIARESGHTYIAAFLQCIPHLFFKGMERDIYWRTQDLEPQEQSKIGQTQQVTTRFFKGSFWIKDPAEVLTVEDMLYRSNSYLNGIAGTASTAWVHLPSNNKDWTKDAFKLMYSGPGEYAHQYGKPDSKMTDREKREYLSFAKSVNLAQTLAFIENNFGTKTESAYLYRGGSTSYTDQMLYLAFPILDVDWQQPGFYNCTKTTQDPSVKTEEDEEIRKIKAYSVHKGRAETEKEKEWIKMIRKMHQAYSDRTKNEIDSSHSKPVLGYSTSLDGYFYGTSTDKVLDPDEHGSDIRDPEDQGNTDTNGNNNERGDESDTDDEDLNFRNGDQVLSRHIARQWIKDCKLRFGAAQSGKTVSIIVR